MAANLPRERADVDRFFEVTGECRVREPGSGFVLRDRGERDHRNRRRRRVLGEPPSRLHAVEVGEAEIDQDDVRLVRCRAASIPAWAVVAVSVRMPACSSTPPASLAFRSSSSTISTSSPTESSYDAVVPIRIVLADDHYLVREGLRRLLETQPELEVVAACADLDELLAAVDAEQPDVVLTDIRMPPTGIDEGVRAAERIREAYPDIGVVVLSQYAEPRYALALLEAGTARRAYLLKERVDDLDQLVAAIRAVADGGSMIDPRIVESLVAEKTRVEASPLHELTPRELDVLREMAEGKNNAAIAETLFLTERSVEKVIHSIFLKLGRPGSPRSTSASRP